MKATEIRELSPQEIEQKRDELHEEIFNLRFQHGIGQLENTIKLKQIRREIARVETILMEKQQNQQSETE
jgi:large subunit ribosomal protein L29